MRFISGRLAASLLFTLVFIPVQAQPPGWNDPHPPHKVMDNLYYVGTSQLSSFLITTPEGHILHSSNYESSVPVIKAAVEELGFDFSDIKILISGHAHPDHIEGDALVKEMTGAEVVVGRLELPYHEAFDTPGGKEQPIDRLIDDGDSVSLGGSTLTAHVQSGHTRGCLAWSLTLEENGHSYNGFIECSLNGQFLRYVGNEQYPEIASDIQQTYQKAKEIPAEVWVSSHGIFYGLDEKFAKLQNRGPGDPNPFNDPEGYVEHVNDFEQIFLDTLVRQVSEANSPE
ncbi:MAG: MBL fold metallo-hydrolase [Gammaproteobacteria bacterium]|nr:MBL fold metallo-hydrolase [Gammaproteobacteria bacterium]